MCTKKCCGNLLKSGLKSTSPDLTSRGASMLVLIFGILMTGMGVLLFIFNSRIIQTKSVQYDNQGINPSLTITVDQKMTSPVHVYMEMTNFYQNNRIMIKSMSPAQLKGNNPAASKLEYSCKNALYNSDIGVGGATAIDGLSILVSTDVAQPCGLMAYNFPNDTFNTLKKVGSQKAITITTTGIAMESSKSKFKNYDLTKQWLDVTDERFINWMKSSSQPSFKKLWGIVNQDLEAGDYTISITNQNTKQYDVSSYNGTKNVLLATSGIVGGRHFTASLMFVILGAYLIVMSFVFMCTYCLNKRSDNVKYT